MRDVRGREGRWLPAAYLGLDLLKRCSVVVEVLESVVMDEHALVRALHSQGGLSLGDGLLAFLGRHRVPLLLDLRRELICLEPRLPGRDFCGIGNE